MREQSSELFSCRTVDEVSIHRSGEEGIPHISSLPCHGRKPKWLFRLEYRPVRRRQRDDLVMLAHMRTAWSLGRHRIARLIRENAMQARQKRRFRKTSDSHHAFPVAPNILAQDFAATGPNQKWDLTFPIFGRKKGGCISLASLVSLHVVLSDGPSVTACIASWLFRLSRKPSQ
ncbi:transposase [Brucella neotomae]|uniref:Integrase n=1 Tax=Brucella neotomae 5K33 TaxID=520456 RepID=A0A7U8PX97_BRUNE|nr:integrase [Brucella neotomae 5K33]KFJ58840.1 putative IS600 orfB family protein [Brucella neotomae 5K33]SPU65779.1 transposase [Brucella neotomae]SPU69479.1 transposase [Brucella neotomae]SUW39309.1 transposase [Brucella neotomae]